MLGKGLADDVPAARAFWDQIEEVRRRTGNAASRMRVQACKVETRYIYQVFRNNPKALVFAQAVLGFELASADPRVVASTSSAMRTTTPPWPTTRSTCAWWAFCAAFIPKFMSACMRASWRWGWCRRKALCCHIRLAVDEAKTDRIGHGVDVMYEDDPKSCSRTWRRKRCWSRSTSPAMRIPRRQRQVASASHLSQIWRSDRAVDGRRRHRAYRPHQ